MQASYKYDANGMRTSKTVNGVKSQYQYVDGKLYYEKRGENEMYFTYDSYGNLSMIHLYRDGNVYTYYAVCNSRGDVKQLYTGNGNLRVEYKYDAWGNTVSVTNGDLLEITNQNDIGNLNPIRYRGYYWDSETNLYYLQSRYYDPTTMRFINADGYVHLELGIIGSNLYAYCGNNPVGRMDQNGDSWLSVLATSIVVAVGCAVAIAAAPVVAPALGIASVGTAVTALTLTESVAWGVAGYAAGREIVSNIPWGSINFAPSQLSINENEKSEAKPIVIDRPREEKILYFPENPNDFNPRGLRLDKKPGSKNGAIWQWDNPLNETRIHSEKEPYICSWHENPNKPDGPHYHLRGYPKAHYYPGEPIPDLFVKQYF